MSIFLCAGQGTVRQAILYAHRSLSLFHFALKYWLNVLCEGLGAFRQAFMYPDRNCHFYFSIGVSSFRICSGMNKFFSLRGFSHLEGFLHQGKGTGNHQYFVLFKNCAKTHSV